MPLRKLSTIRDAVKSKLKALHLLGVVRWLSEVFCFILDITAELVRFIGRPPAFDKKKVKRILAIRLDRIGDLILTTPALRAIKDSYPGSHLTVLVRRQTKDLIEGLPFIDEIIVSDDFSDEKLIARLREGRFDVSLGFYPGLGINYLPWNAEIPYRVGYRYFGTGILLTKSLIDDRSTRIRHEVTSALEVVALIGAKPKDMSLAIAIHKEGEEFAERFYKENGFLDGAVVVIHPGSRQPYIRWDKARFAEVADRLIRESGVKVLLIGGPDEGSLVTDVKKLVTQNVTVALGPPLPRLISLIKRARLFIGNSSGPMHIAAALKVPVVAIFGSAHPKDSPEEWGPWGEGHTVIAKNTSCGRCHPGDCATFKCLDAVTVADVVQAAKNKL